MDVSKVVEKARALKGAVGGAIVGAAGVAGSAMAVPTFDVTSITDTITAVVAAAALIGAAALAMHYGVRAWKWLRGAG